jgi:glucan phosphoethanolaminetransferase (alkaline phosphatase superfamily)
MSSEKQSELIVAPSAWHLAAFAMLCSPAVCRLMFDKSPHASIALLVQLVVVAGLFFSFIRWRYFALSWSFFSALAVIDTLHYIEYREGLSVRTLAIAFQTPLEQTIGFLKPRWLGLLVVFALAVYAYVRICSASVPTVQKNIGRKVLQVTAAIMSAGFATLTAITIAVMLGANDSWLNNFTRFAADNVARSYPYRPVLNLLAYVVSERKYDQFQSVKLAIDWSSKIKINSNKNGGTLTEAVVIVLGESSNRSRWGLYGYSRDTNPKLKQNVGIIRLDDVVTPWNSTMTSVPILMTQKSLTDKELYTSQPGLPLVFQAAGFETYWISNQGSSGNFDRSIRQLYSEAQHQEFVAGKTALLMGQPGDDAQLIQPLARALGSSAKRVFVVLHTQGSHYPFWERYPKSREQFLPSKAGGDFINNRFRNNDWQEVSNSYDNSILYTDHVLDQFIQVLEKSGRKSILLYASDHGQSLPTQHCSELGQGYANRDNFEVPAFIWLSSAFAKDSIASQEILRLNAKKSISTSAFFPTVLALAGVELDGVAPNASLLSKDFRGSEQLVHSDKNVVLFQSLDSTNNCTR